MLPVNYNILLLYAARERTCDRRRRNFVVFTCFATGRIVETCLVASGRRLKKLPTETSCSIVWCALRRRRCCEHIIICIICKCQQLVAGNRDYFQKRTTMRDFRRTRRAYIYCAQRDLFLNGAIILLCPMIDDIIIRYFDVCKKIKTVNNIS